MASGLREVSDALIPGKEPQYVFDMRLDGMYLDVIYCNKPCSILLAITVNEE